MNNISVGDLVMVVKPMQCCGIAGSIGLIYKVSNVIDSIASDVCPKCKRRCKSKLAIDPADGFGIDIDRLKKIPPLSKPDDIKTNEEITA